ncbi:MAG: RNA polymerase sigma factor [Desulfomonilaceae bacterium]
MSITTKGTRDSFEATPDQEGMEKIYNHYRPYIFKIVGKFYQFRACDLCEDAVQDIFLKLMDHDFRAIRSFKGSSEPKFKAYIGKIALNECLKLIKKQNLEAQILISVGDALENSFDADPLSDDTRSDFCCAPSPEDLVLKQEAIALVNEGLDKLSDDKRETLELKMDGMTQEEIAKELCTAPHNVNNWAARAQRDLRNIILDSHPDVKKGSFF